MRKSEYGGPQMEQRILDWGTRNYYDLCLPKWEVNLMDIAQHGSLMWRQIEEPDPWEALAAAVVADAAEDYILCLVDKDDELAGQIEQWFARNAYTWGFFETLKAMTDRCFSRDELCRLRKRIRLIR